MQALLCIICVILSVLLIAIIVPTVCVFLSTGADLLVMFASIIIRQLAFLPTFLEVKGMAGVDLVNI